MPAETKTNEKKQRLLGLLREMFQLDQPDLDFGLYRIMHAKREQLETFLETEFDQLIDKVFADRGARHEEDARREYEAARQQAAEFGAPDPDAAPKVQQARARYDVIRLSGGENAEIYDHLHRFFSRYYDQGDFMSLRRYGKGAAGGAETYAVPYDGAEVVLHWANKDQYYIKTTENFAAFSFDPRKALHKDERGVSRSLFDDADTGGAALKVHFRVVDAAEGAHNNVKASDKDERYFILDAAEPLAWEGSELVVRINYRSDPAKPPKGQKQKWQATRNEQLVQTVLDALKGLNGSGNALAGEYFEVLAREVGKGKDKTQPLLARYIGQYTATNTMDYFIHKDLGGFLRRELDFYLKNEVLKLDDFVGGEDADVQAGLSDARMKAMKEALEKAQAIRILSLRLIDFLAQLEDFQKKLWLKKKFVVETHYCITLDRIPEKFYPEIAANERQREEWVRLFAIDEIKGDMATPKYSVPLTVEFLKTNHFLVLDSVLYPENFRQRLLAEFEDLDEQCGGLAVHSENFQALQLTRRKLSGQVRCIYIDPPYNTGQDGFLYKDAFSSSSWASMISDRLRLARVHLSEKGVLFASINEIERFGLEWQLSQTFGHENRIEEVVWVRDTVSNNSPTYSTAHEYVEVFAANLKAVESDKQMFRDVKPGYFEVMELVESLQATYPPIHYIEDRLKDLYQSHKIEHISEAMSRGQSKEDAIKSDPWKGLYPYKYAEYRDNNGNFVDEEIAAERKCRIWVWREVEPSMPSGKQSETIKDPSSENFRFYQPLHPTTKRPCQFPKRGWAFPRRAIGSRPSYEAYFRDQRIAFKDDEQSIPQLKYFLHEVSSVVATSVIRQYPDGEPRLESLFGEKGLINNPKPPGLIETFIKQTTEPKDYILDFFGGSGTTGQAVIDLNRKERTDRKFIVVEMGGHFNSVLLPRIKKAIFSQDWEEGKPKSNNGISCTFKYIRLESYEDCLNNLALNPYIETAAKIKDPAMQRDYLLRYMLEVETHGSQSLLNVAQFRDPTACRLEIKKPGSDEREQRNVDLVETFNWLIGLHVDKLHAGRRFTASFVRKPDPLLPQDAHTRLQATALTEAEDGAWWFRPVEGYVRTRPGDDLHRQSVLVLWRTLTDDPEQDAAVLEAFLSQKMKWNPTRREDKTLYDLIYINGTHNLPNLGKYGEVRLLEEEFHRRMWAGEES